MKVTFSFNLPDDDYDYHLHKQAQSMFDALDEIRQGLRTMEKYDSFPISREMFKIIGENLTENEKHNQEAWWARLEAKAEKEYQSTLQKAEIRGIDPKSIVKPQIPHAYSIYDENGHSMISGSSMIGIIRDYFHDILSEYEVKLDP